MRQQRRSTTCNGVDHPLGEVGTDVLRGGARRDTLRTCASNDEVENVSGSGSADELFGTDGANRLFGAGGDDLLRGRKGDDELKGGGGADVFVFDRKGDRDRIVDFEDDVDTIQLGGSLGLSGRDAAMACTRQVGNDVVFDFGKRDVLVVEDAAKADLRDDLLL